MKWKDFVGRRRLDVSEWVKNKGILTVKEFQDACTQVGVESPSDKEIETMLPKPLEVGSKVKLPSGKVAVVTSIEVLDEKQMSEVVESMPEELEEELAEEVSNKPKRGRKKKSEVDSSESDE